MAGRARAGEGEGYRDGSRWINHPPGEEELRAWFRESVQLHEGMDAADYEGGIVLIPAREKFQQTRMAADGSSEIAEGYRMTYTPYPKVEARLAYWHRWRELHPELVCSLEPDPNVARVDDPADARFNGHLPDGFYVLPITTETGAITYMLGCSMRVTVHDRSDWEAARRAGTYPLPYFEVPPGSKTVPMLHRWGADENAIAKAQTGAVGRALGFAGMLLIPGTGVATADDMQERDTEARPAPTPESGTGDVTRASAGERAAELLARLRDLDAERYELIEAWARERSIPDLNDPPREALRGLVRRLEQLVSEAEAAKKKAAA
jgi:hypothetical protein